MAYKVSFGSYQHSGSLQATVDITGSTTVSGAVGNFGTLTVSSFSPANISSTNITASSNMSASTANFGTLTVGTFSPANISTTTLTVTGVTTLSGNVALGDAPADVITVNGQITGSLFAINGGAINATTIGASTQSSGKFTTLSASSTLDVGGTTTVQALSSSVGVSASVGQFGTLTVTSFNPASISTTSLTATTGSFTTVAGGFVDALSNNKLPYWNDTAGQFADSFVETNTVSGTTTISGSGGLMTYGTLNVVGGAISSSVGVSSSVGQFGALTVATFTPSTINTTTLTVTGITTLSGNVFLGDAPADVITVNGQITGSLFAINGGTINGTTIGATTPSSVQATTLSASSTLQAGGLASLNGGVNSTNISGSGALQAGGIATIGNGLIVTLGGATITGTVAVSGAISSTGNITSNGTISSSLGVQAGSNISALNGRVTAQTLTASVGSTLGATLVTSLSSSGNVIVGGDLTVQGTTTTVNSTTLEITDKNIVIASGSTTSLLANGSGLTLGSTGYQFNFQSSSAGTSTDFFQVSGTAGLTDFKAKTVFATVDGNVTQQVTNLGDANGTLSVGINYSQADFTAPHTWTLPASPSVGQSVKVKAPHNCNITNTLTVSAGAKAIDFTGNTTVVLASPDAALELVYVDSANNLWKIF